MVVLLLIPSILTHVHGQSPYCAGTLTLQHEKGTVASGLLPGLGEPGDRVCAELPTPNPSDADFDDCWAFLEDIPTGLCETGALGANPVDFILMNPSQAYYKWGVDRVVSTMERVCPPSQECIQTCPPEGSVEYDLCLEYCQEICPSAADDKLGVVAVAGVIIGCICGVALVGMIFLNTQRQPSDGMDYQREESEALNPDGKSGSTLDSSTSVQMLQ
jgi:hypothetical protein